MGVLVAAAAVAGSALDVEFGGGGVTTPAPDPSVARVEEIIDGDTIRVRFVSGAVRTVRYIGIDTPETPPGGQTSDCFGPEAARANRRLVPLGEEVRLEFGEERRDRYGRLLAYVYRAGDGLFVNAALLRSGYATVLTVPPNTQYVERFLALAREARNGRRGLWGACDVTST